jgi:hypothetical protein
MQAEWVPLDKIQGIFFGDKMPYYIENTQYLGRPGPRPRCFPEGLNTEGFIEVTRIFDDWAVFIAPDGKIHDCEEYYKQYLNEIKRTQHVKQSWPW